MKTLFKIMNWNHFKLKAHNNKPYYNLIEVRGFRTALIETYAGQRSVVRFYWSIFKIKI